MTYCLDANVWVYYLDADLPEHERVAPQVDAVLADEPLFTTTVLQMEVAHYVANTLERSESVLARFLGVPDTVVADLTGADVERAVSLLHEHPNVGIGGRDATVLAGMERYDVGRLWTHDRALKSAATEMGLSVHDPVEDDPPTELDVGTAVDSSDTS